MTNLPARVGAALVVAASFALLLPSQAFAAEPASEVERATLEAAKAHFLQAKELFDKGLYTRALEAFRKSRELVPGPAIAYNIARCHEYLGQYDEAIAAYREYLRLAGEPEDAAAVRATIKKLSKEITDRVRMKDVPRGPRKGRFFLAPRWWAVAAVGGVVLGGFALTTVVLISQRSVRTDLEINPGGS